MLIPQYGKNERKVLRQTLEGILPAMGLADAGIDRVRRQRSGLSTSYDTAIVTVRLDDGKVVKIFLKNYDTYIKTKDDMHERREREIRVYEELLSADELGTAAFYGSVWDDANSRHWLLLEFVEGIPVKWREIDDWLTAAEQLGRIHGYFYRQTARLRSCGYLASNDADSLQSKANKAAAVVEITAPHLSSAFAKVVGDYTACVDAMVASPFTLVHGEYRPKNVMVCRSADNPRFCVYDWEAAAFGSPYYDLAYLVDGFESPMLNGFFDRYVEGAGSYGMPTPSHARMRYEVDCFRLHMIVNLLARADIKGYANDIVSKLVGHALTRHEDVQRSANA